MAATNRLYKETGKGLSQQGMNDRLPILKKEFEWLAEPYSQVLQSVSLNLSRAFVNFFEGRAKYPNFKSKHGLQSIQYPQNVKLFAKAIKLPKLGEIPAKIHRLFEGKLKTVTVSLTKAGQYFASLLFDDGQPSIQKCSNGKALGIDLGLTDFAVTSDGAKFANPRHLRKHEKNLRRKQKKLSRKQKNSNTRNKARKLVARVHARISNVRRDFLHKLSRKMVNENQVISVENLAVKNMVKNHNLAKAISDYGWSEFTSMLKYKAEKEGKVYIEVDRFFLSSKTCHVCLNQIGSLPLDIRTWECSYCQTKHDRDINAAINIREEGMRILVSQYGLGVSPSGVTGEPARALGTSASASEGNVRPKRGRKSSVEAIPVEIGSPILAPTRFLG